MPLGRLRVQAAAARTVRAVRRPGSRDLDVDGARTVLAEVMEALGAGAAAADRAPRKRPHAEDPE